MNSNCFAIFFQQHSSYACSDIFYHHLLAVVPNFCYVYYPTYVFFAVHPRYLFIQFTSPFCHASTISAWFIRVTDLEFNSQKVNEYTYFIFSGLRGAVAFALAMRNTESESRQLMLTCTLMIVLVTVICCGGTTMSALTFLKIK